MLFTLDEIMTPREACDRWGVTLDSLHMKLSRLKDSDLLNGLIKEGKAKYYKPEGKKRGEWIFTVEAMEVLYPGKS
ncbi:helix-turn-helix domain-containing protein [Bacillus mycoides]|uniref:helix-turn-helix domain-containing protein n=1 Tax=Bacillus TaxID=1386 RepID=UPI00366FD900